MLKVEKTRLWGVIPDWVYDEPERTTTQEEDEEDEALAFLQADTLIEDR